MAWVYLLIAALFEIAWAVGLKYAQGFSKLWPSVLTVAAMVASLSFLAFALRTIPVGTGYAVWTGLGAVGTAILGIILFSEPVSVWRGFCLLLILGGVVGLKFSVPSLPADGAADRRSPCPEGSVQTLPPGHRCAASPLDQPCRALSTLPGCQGGERPAGSSRAPRGST
jgi:quaternary ammonium compound-resistance protein SugE